MGLPVSCGAKSLIIFLILALWQMSEVVDLAYVIRQTEECRFFYFLKKIWEDKIDKVVELILKFKFLIKMKQQI